MTLIVDFWSAYGEDLLFRIDFTDEYMWIHYSGSIYHIDSGYLYQNKKQFAL